MPSWDTAGPYTRRPLEPTEELPVVRVRRRFWPPLAALLAAGAVAAILAWTLAGAHHGLPPTPPGSTATALTVVYWRGVVTLPPAPVVLATTALVTLHTHAPAERRTHAAPTPSATPIPVALTPSPAAPSPTQSAVTVAPTVAGPTSTGGAQ